MTKARTLADFNTTAIPASLLTGALPALDGSALTNLAAGNTPIWKVWRSGAFSMGTGADTIVPFDEAAIDPDSLLNTANGRVTPAVAGKYLIMAQVRIDATADFNMWYADIRISGTNVANAQVYHDHGGTVSVSAIVDLTDSDYIEVVAMQNSGGTLSGQGVGQYDTFMQGFKIT